MSQQFMEKVEYKKIKISLILLCLREIVNKKRALLAHKKNKEDIAVLLTYFKQNQE